MAQTRRVGLIRAKHSGVTTVRSAATSTSSSRRPAESTRVRDYDANGNLVRRTGHESISGYFSLSPVGDPPRIDVIVHQNWVDEFTVPGDLSSELETVRGLIAHVGGSSAPGFGADLHASGRVLPDGTFHGLNHDFFTPGANEAFCAALGA